MATIEPSPERWPELAALVDELAAVRAEIAALHAREAIAYARALELVLSRVEERRLLEPDRPDSDLVVRSVSAEIGAALRISDRSVQRRFGEAGALVDHYPRVLDALQGGRIDRGHATAIVEAGMSVSCDSRGVYEARALEVAECESVPRTRAAVATLAAAIDPESAQTALSRARRDRRVRVYDLPDGMARVLADLPAPLAYAIADRLTGVSHAVIEARRSAPDVVPAPGAETECVPDDRTIDEVRADVLADLLLTGTPTGHGDPESLSGITGRVQVTVPVLTLAGVSEQPAVLAGYGSVDAGIVRALAARAPGWDRVLTDACSGLPVGVDRYRPSAEQRRYLAARDEHCRFPGCRMPAHRCDIDHTIDAAHGGPTDCRNLAHFCERHHVMKHHTAWTVRQLPGGILEWTSPLGRRYEDRPPPTVRFVPSGDPPPS
ncbi:MAG: DUF222 domain-containing protein [Microbacterium sp.]|uniref:HNH endonuclease signature motif containing protein n=2 Tax=Microbacterium sp. TaxID=51671 RepID=UPI001AD26E7A|nr:HNH endonuclease signature motif containing protein [Microbacterium sp.]MBN9152537.1 DUF222 domain-containing protein [Microbacterium sp.]